MLMVMPAVVNESSHPVFAHFGDCLCKPAEFDKAVLVNGRHHLA
jgi:hypothetical protein